MYDSTNPFDIPLGVEMVAGYIDGAYAWPQAGWDRFGSIPKVRISCTNADLAADVLDVEPGCADIPTAVNWTQTLRGIGRQPALYFSASLYSQVEAAFVAIGSLVPLVWIADWDGVFGPWFGSVAKQYANPAITGGHFDLSWVADYWPGVDGLAPPVAVGGAAGNAQAWSSLQSLFNSDLPGFGNELGVLASSLDSIG
jgi:hypothetical protein